MIHADHKFLMTPFGGQRLRRAEINASLAWLLRSLQISNDHMPVRLTACTSLHTVPTIYENTFSNPERGDFFILSQGVQYHQHAHRERRGYSTNTTKQANKLSRSASREQEPYLHTMLDTSQHDQLSPRDPNLAPPRQQPRAHTKYGHSESRYSPQAHLPHYPSTPSNLQANPQRSLINPLRQQHFRNQTPHLSGDIQAADR